MQSPLTLTSTYFQRSFTVLKIAEICKNQHVLEQHTNNHENRIPISINSTVSGNVQSIQFPTLHQAYITEQSAPTLQQENRLCKIVCVHS